MLFRSFVGQVQSGMANVRKSRAIIGKAISDAAREIEASPEDKAGTRKALLRVSAILAEHSQVVWNEGVANCREQLGEYRKQVELLAKISGIGE